MSQKHLTPEDVSNLVESGDIIGMTIKVGYSSGENSQYPVIFHFTGFGYPFGEHSKYLEYILHNKNTEAYWYPKKFQFNAREFARSWRDRHHYDFEQVDYIVVIDGMEREEPEWEL
jgi:hypothetical protein